MARMLTMPLEQYEDDRRLARQAGHAEGRKAEREKLRPLLDLVMDLTAITVTTKGVGDEHWTFNEEWHVNRVRQELREACIAAGEIDV